MSGSPRILVDCRWLGRGGVGRVAEMLLTAWSQDPPAGEWILWGPEAVDAYLWPGARRIDGVARSLPIGDQVRVRRLPPVDLCFFLHQIHALPSTPYVSAVYDTTPLRWGGSPMMRLLKRIYLTVLARRARRLITISDFSRARILQDLGVGESGVEVLTLPENTAWTERVRGMRAVTAAAPVAMFVGRFARHKNLDRLVRVFPGTEFARTGGTLRLIGGEPGELEAMRAQVAAAGQSEAIQVDGVLGQDELDQLYAQAAFLIVPSYEEGYGLPAREALSVGLPVCLSTGGALAEFGPFAAATFAPDDDAGMAAAIDRAAAATGVADGLPPVPDLAAYGRAVAALLIAAAGRP